jgi:hypothetical protein
LFNDSKFVQATIQTLVFFRGELPLLYARIKQLRGELPEAITDYVAFRFSDSTTFVTDKRQLVPTPVQEGLDVYSTYYLALAHLEGGNLKDAELMFRRLLEMVPEPGPAVPFYCMFRWGAQTNLARIYEAQGDARKAIALYMAPIPTMQAHGNMLKARELVWNDPTAEPPDPLPPAPKAFSRLSAEAQAKAQTKTDADAEADAEKQAEDRADDKSDASAPSPTEAKPEPKK